MLDGVAHTVVGVMPPSFEFPYDAEIWVPMRIELLPNLSWMRPVVGRLRAGTSREAAEREVAGIVATVDAPAGHDMVTRVTPLKGFVTAGVERSIRVFAGAVAFVLLIACANVANLLLIRGASRGHELVVRSALGANPGRLMRQMLTESLVIALLGGATGILICVLSVRGLVAIAPAGRIPRLDEIRVDGVVLAVSFAATVVAGLLFGLAPALATTRKRLREAMGGGARTIGGDHERVRRALAISEIAFAIVLLSGAGLLLRSFSRMRAVDPGFDTDDALVLELALPDLDYPDAAKRQAFYTALRERLSAIPGVLETGGVNSRPLGMQLIRGDFTMPHAERPPGYVLDKLVATPGYFHAMGIDLLYGRGFTDADRATALGVALVSRSVAARFWPPDGEAAVGSRIAANGDPQPEDWLTIVGVVDDVAQQAITTGKGRALYLPMLQTDRVAFLAEMTFVVRTQQDPVVVTPAIRAAVSELDPNLPVPALARMEHIVALTIAEPQFEARLLSAFSLLAQLLAAVGTYGVLAHDVTARTREIGVRIALGAERAAVVRMVLSRVILVAAPGIALGILTTLALTRVLTYSLFEVSPTDPTTLLSVSAALLGVSLLAACLPAHRATRVDPLVALRHD
jgi:predicted permease